MRRLASDSGGHRDQASRDFRSEHLTNGRQRRNMRDQSRATWSSLRGHDDQTRTTRPDDGEWHVDTAVRAGSLAELQAEGRLLTKVGALPVVVLWHEGRAWAIEDRCPHLGFPLHRGTVEAGLLTCHWHHARFDLASGCTLDPWADDARAFDVAVDGDDVLVATRAAGEPGRAAAPPAAGRSGAGAHPRHRQGHPRPARAAGRGRRGGPHRARLRPDQPSRRLGLGPHRAGGDGQRPAPPRRTTTVPWRSSTPSPSSPATPSATRPASRSSRSIRPGCPRGAPGRLVPPVRRHPLRRRRRAHAGHRRGRWSGRGGGGRGDAAGRGHRPRLHRRGPHPRLHQQGGRGAGLRRPRTGPSTVLTSLVAQTCRADRAEESSEWRHPDRPRRARRAGRRRCSLAAVDKGAGTTFGDVGTLGWALLEDDPEAVVEAILGAAAAGATARAARPGRGLRRRPAHHPLPRPERPRRLGHGPPLLHHRQRAPPGAVPPRRRPSCCGACCTGRSASTSTAS